MSSDPVPSDAGSRGRIDAATDLFETEWKAGRRARLELEEVLAQHEPDCQPELLRELLITEWQLRQRDGEPIVVSEYLARFPDHRELIEQLASAETTVTFAEAAATAEPLELSVVGQYTLLRKLGQGGMGTVFEAEHLKLHKRVALKLLSKERTVDANTVSRFEREMQAVGQLDHPHIVRATDAGEADGQHFLVMDLIDGIDLNDLLKRVGQAFQPDPNAPRAPNLALGAANGVDRRSGQAGKPDLRIADACELIRQAALGLQHAHEHGLVHRDIKPSNLMLCLVPGAAGLEPIVKVLDFGLALLSSQSEHELTSLTSTQQVMGTLDYLAPEQAGDSHRVDIRADLYSLGVTLYKLLTGRTPFADLGRSSQMAKLMAIANETAPAIQSLRADVPPELAVLVHQLMEKQRDRRPANPRDVAASLLPFCTGCDLHALAERVLNREKLGERGGVSPPVVALSDKSRGADAAPLADVSGIRSHGVTRLLSSDPVLSSTQILRPTNRAASKRRWLLAVPLLLLVGVTAWFVKIAQKDGTVTKDDSASDISNSKSQISDLKSQIANSKGDEVQEPASPTNLRVGLRVKADKPLVLPAVETVTRKPLSRSALVPRPAALKGVQSWSVETKGHRGAVWAVAFCPTDDNFLASACDDGVVRIWNTQTGDLVSVLVGHDEAIHDLVWFKANDAQASGAASAPRSSAESATTGGLTPPRSPNLRSGHGVTGLLATACEDGTVRIWDAKSGRTLHTLEDHGAPVVDLDLSHDGRHLACATAKFTRIWNVADWSRDKDIQQGGFAAWSADDSLLATGGGFQTTLVWNATTGQEHAKLAVPSTQYGVSPDSAIWSPTGRMLLITGHVRGTGSDLWDVDEKKIDRKFPAMNVGGVAWSQDGTKIVTVGIGGSVRVWDNNSEKQLAEATLPDLPEVSRSDRWAECVAFTRDGSMFAVGSEVATLDLFETATGKRIRRIGVPQANQVRYGAWHPDARRLAVTNEDDHLRVWDTKPADLLDEVSVNAALGVGWSPDGTSLIVGQDVSRGGLQHFAVNPRSKLHLTRQFPPEASAAGLQTRWIHWFSDAKSLFVAASKMWSTGQQLLIDVETGRATDAQDLKIRQFAWSPDEKRMAFSTQAYYVYSVQIWNRNTKQIVQTLAAHTSEVDAVAWSPDQTRLATASRTDGVFIWDMS